MTCPRCHQSVTGKHECYNSVLNEGVSVAEHVGSAALEDLMNPGSGILGDAPVPDVEPVTAREPSKLTLEQRAYQKYYETQAQTSGEIVKMMTEFAAAEASSLRGTGGEQDEFKEAAYRLENTIRLLRVESESREEKLRECLRQVAEWAKPCAGPDTMLVLNADEVLRIVEAALKP
jgi:hypothetical protein